MPETAPSLCCGGCGAVATFYCDECHLTALLQAEAEERQQQIERHLKASGLPLRFRMGEMTLESFTAATGKQKATIAACKDLLDGNGPSVLLLTGGVGVGKTHLAGATLTAWIRGGKSGIFTTLLNLLLHVRSSFDQEGVSEYQIVNSYRRTGMLILDDVGVERASEHSVATLFNILDARMGEKLPTILTSNYKAPQLAQHLGVGEEAQVVSARILDRIIGEGKALELDGTSQRRRKN